MRPSLVTVAALLVVAMAVACNAACSQGELLKLLAALVRDTARHAHDTCVCAGLAALYRFEDALNIGADVCGAATLPQKSFV
jgi:hypothetical protein